MDGSERSSRAYALAIDIAKKYHADLYVFAVARPPDIDDDAEIAATIKNSTKHYEKVLARLEAQAPFHGVQPHFELAVGHPAEQITCRAEQSNADVIVIGNSGKTGMDPWLLGSVSQRVLQHAHCPVMVVS